MTWIIKKLDGLIVGLEDWLRRHDKKNFNRTVFRSECIHCHEMSQGSIETGFIHLTTGKEKCRIPGMDVKATPKSMFSKGQK